MHVPQLYYPFEVTCLHSNDSADNLQLQASIDRLIGYCAHIATYKGNPPWMTLVQSSFKESNGLKILLVNMHGIFYLYVFLGDHAIGSLSTRNLISSIITRAVLDEQGARILLELEHKSWIALELSGYISALLRDELSLQEIVYIFALGHLDDMLSCSDFCPEVDWSKTLEKLRSHPLLKSIKEKNETLYNDLTSMLDTIEWNSQPSPLEEFACALHDGYALGDSNILGLNSDKKV